MAQNETNAQLFLSAFANIESILAKQQGRRESSQDWPTFGDLLDRSDTLLRHQKEQLRGFARLRNAISHNPYRAGEAIADPRSDVVDAIEKIYRGLAKPPLLVDAAIFDGPLRIFEATDDVNEFLLLVTEHDFSQAPVRAERGFELITTNAVARWFASNLLEHGGILETSPIRDVLAFAEPGDRVVSVNPMTTTVQAINMFSGQADIAKEPPAALIVQGEMGRPPQKMYVRADLAVLYKQLEED